MVRKASSLLLGLTLLAGCGEANAPRELQRECVKSEYELKYVNVLGEGLKPAMVEVCYEWAIPTPTPTSVVEEEEGDYDEW